MSLAFKIILFFFITFPGFTLAEDSQLVCPDDIEAKSVGEMFLEAEFSGLRALGMDNHHCLRQKNFPHVRIVHDPPQEASENFHFYILDSNEYEVTNVEVLDEKVGLHRIHFEVKAYLSNEDSDPEVQKYTDQLTYVFYPSERMRQHNGCGGIISTPEKIFLKKECLPEEI